MQEEWQITEGRKPEWGGGGSHSSVLLNPFQRRKQAAPEAARRDVFINGLC